MTQLPGSTHPHGTALAPAVMLADAAHAQQEALTQADQIAAETLIRTTVQALANGSPVRDLDDVVRRNAGRATLNDIRSGRLGSSVLGDIIGAVEQAKGNTNINWNSATPQQISAFMLAHGLSAIQVQRMLGVGKAEAEREARGGLARGSERVTSSNYDQTLNSSESAVLGSLSKTYGAVAARSALDFAQQMGTTPDMARKFVKMDQQSRTDVKDFVKGVVNDPSLTEEQKKQKVQEFRQSHPGAARALTHDDMMKLIRDGDKFKVKKDGPQASNFGETQENREADNQATGVARKIETEHRTTVAVVEQKPGTSQPDEDLVAGLAARKVPLAPGPDTAPSAKPPATVTQQNTGTATNGKSVADAGVAMDKSKPATQRQTVNQKAMNPTA